MTSQLIQKAVEKVLKLKDKYRKRDHYDGNSLWEASNYYNISAESWNEIIRLEDGALMAINDVSELLPQIITGVIEEYIEQNDDGMWSGREHIDNLLLALKEVVKE